MKTLTKISALIFLLCSTLMAKAQTPNWQWATSGTGTGSEGVTKVISDNNGNIVVCGVYAGEMTLGGTTVSVHANNAGIPFNTNDLFVAKYDGGGNLLWVVYPTAADTTFSSRVWDISADPAGNIYAFVSFAPITSISGLVFGTDTIYSNGSLLKFDPSGSILYRSDINASSWTGHNDTRITLDDQGNIFVCQKFGFNESVRVYDTVTVTNQHPASFNEAILVKYNSTGSALWGRSAGGISFDDPSDIKTDASGNVYLFGTFNSDTIFFDATNYVVNTAASAFGPSDYYYAKYDASGNVVWARSIAYGSAGLTMPNIQIKPVVTAAGEIYMTEPQLAPNFMIGTIPLNAPGFYIAKADVNGVPVWANVIGDTLLDAVFDLQDDASGNLYFTGSFGTDSIVISGVTLYNSTPGTGTRDYYVAMVDANGNPLGAFSGGGDNFDSPVFYVNDNGSIYLSGSFSSNSLTFGTTTLNNPNFPNGHLFLSYTTPVLSGLNETYFENNFNIYPNPVGSELNLKAKHSFDTNTKVKILNVMGETVYSGIISDLKQHSMDVSMLPAGVYLMQIQSGTKEVSGKFVKY